MLTRHEKIEIKKTLSFLYQNKMGDINNHIRQTIEIELLNNYELLKFLNRRIKKKLLSSSNLSGMLIYSYILNWHASDSDILGRWPDTINTSIDVTLDKYYPENYLIESDYQARKNIIKTFIINFLKRNGWYIAPAYEKNRVGNFFEIQFDIDLSFRQMEFEED